MKYDGERLLKLSSEFEKKLSAIKANHSKEFEWYPYGTLNNFIHCKEMFDKFPLEDLTNISKTILDIGAADGDLAFFLESLGYEIAIIDNPPTNFNHLKGAKKLIELLNSKVIVNEIDIDDQFVIDEKKYDLIFLLGILYHLKNPFYILEKLSKLSNYLLISTRVAKYTPQGVRIQNESLAYLLDKDESNNDATNFWIFSEKGLTRIFERAGWEVKYITFVGNTAESNPCDSSKDERAFALLKSKNI